ncbi:ATP-binding cassette subfamily B protein/ATP-binding cassette subfamily C protein [Thermosporothrix hazakensis]|uniref:ATP-binding cassette subfamily B protein/ATP-binding cassette subfamily C protein n=1 Tax=Thermosporothrix hazakensis TaxID=644383 RepID=A0A326UAU2_THEHA|nr:ABC transporter ATP-binding protein [Thermosporothrix hazakensis]PZW34260.1 ATP-binding cassette subfamily B protein/ATP-binding cassette subfamily C protein [Thermosporothrix hazakensis]GCE46189.1 helicase [Thermosporothrix hazakensis]
MHFLRALSRYWHLLSRYLRPQWWRIGLLALILCCTIGVQVATPLVTSAFIDRAISGGELSDLMVLALATIALALLQQGMAIAETGIAEMVSWTATNTLRADLLTHLLRLDASFHTAHTPGELIERVDGDVATLARFFSRFVVYVLGNGILMLGVLGLLYHIDWRVGLVMSGFVVVALIIILRIRAAATPLWAADRQANADFFGFLSEYLAGLQDIRSSGASAFVLRRFAEVLRSWLPITRKAQMWGYGMTAVSMGLFSLGTAASFALCALLYQSGLLTIGVVYLVFRYTRMLREPVEQIRDEIQDLQQADASISRIEALLRIQPRIVDGPVSSLPSGPLAIELENVSFAYAEDAPVLRNVSFSLVPGRVLGVVGRTGSGKTTLTRLLLRSYDPQVGTVRLNGVDLRDVKLAAIRSRIGMVTQEVHLFRASVRDNLTLFEAGFSDERIREILETLGLADWLQELPQGLDTVLLSDGAGLSAGQAQVIACARIMLHDPDLVILDEASSRLDPLTDRLVHTALGRMLEGRTGIIIAHRLATLTYADEILVMEDGQVREHGPRRALMADPNSRFAELLRVATEEVTL